MTVQALRCLDVAVIFNLEKIAHWSNEGMSGKLSFGNGSGSSGSDHY